MAEPSGIERPVGHETASESFQLFGYKLKTFRPDQVSKEPFKRYSDPQDEAEVYEIEGALIKLEPVIPESGQARYILAGTSADIDSPRHGGMGVVRKMKDRKTGRLVAAKRADMSRNAILEARRLAKFRHPNVVKFYDFAITNPDNPKHREVYIITEWLEGGTLQSWCQKAHPLKEVAQVVNQIAAGIEYINHQGFIYGDLKPLNLVFDKSGNVKIVDVGISQKYDEHGKAQGFGISSPNYAPPEQRDRKLSIQTDVYSLAAIVFTILHGEIGIITKIDRDDFVKDKKALIPLRKEYLDQFQFKPELHEKLSNVLRKALSVNPRQRHKSVAKLNQELQEIFSKVI